MTTVHLVVRRGLKRLESAGLTLCAAVPLVLGGQGCDRSPESGSAIPEARAAELRASSLNPDGRDGADMGPRPVSAIPRWNQWSLLDADQRRALRLRVARSSRADWVRLVQEGGGPERGLGLFLADQHGDVAALLTWCGLLEDHRETLPYPLPNAWSGPMVTHSQTVSGYLTTLYLAWFGVDVDGDRARCEAFLGGLETPDVPVRPWIERLLRARDDAERHRLKRVLLELPEPERAVVLLLAFEHDLMNRDEVCDAWNGIRAGLRADLEAGVAVLPDEPMFRAQGPRFLSRLAAVANRLTACLEATGQKPER